MECRGCGCGYNVTRGMPVLLTKESELRIKRFYERRKQSKDTSSSAAEQRIRFRKLARIIEPPSGVRWGDNRGQKLRAAWKLAQDHADGNAARGVRTLCIGNLHVPEASRSFTEELNSSSASFVHMVIINKPHIDVVADGYNLPFPDGSFDLVIAQATFKHLSNPVEFVREVSRVLGESGVLYAEFAYLLVYHRWPGDYLRYTPLGIRELLNGFETVELGPSRGASFTLVEVLTVYLACLVSLNNRYLYSTFKTLFGWLLHPIRYLDLLLRTNTWAEQISQVDYCVARKRVDERDLRDGRGDRPLAAD